MKYCVDIGREDKKILEIETYYNEGGMNYFNGSIIKKGIYVSFSLIRKTESGGIERQFYGEDDFCIMLVELTRKNAKKLESVSNAILSNANELAEFYKNKDRESILNLCRKLID